ncbi:MAG: hypothetical protein JWN10_398 [Solirubrobacterales bacterium]|nr:hypothetical protein [Solirubrobacterales bacterium]
MGQAPVAAEGRRRERPVAVRRRTAGLGLLGLVLGTLALGGCGLVTASAPTAVELLVTSEFGARVLHRSGPLRASAHETVLGLLSRYDAVRVSPDGRHVQSIDGVTGATSAGGHEAPGEWLYYVNGVQVPTAPATTSVRPGDHVWWDLHDASHSENAAVVVGSFPEPFLNGVEGKRLPVRIECVSVSGHACQAVTAGLRESAVPAAIAAVGSGGAPETLRVLVGPWGRIGGELAVEGVGRGPSVSGVYASFSSDGRALTLLDRHGRPVQRLTRDAGLVAATQSAKEEPVWLVTGTDEAGVELAARAFNRTALADHFALALAPGAAIALPAR